MAIRTYLAMTTEEIAAPDKIPENAAWMVCPFSGEMEEASSQMVSGGILVLTDEVPPMASVPEDLIWKILSLQPAGVLLDFQRTADKAGVNFVNRLRDALPCPVILPHKYAEALGGPVFLPPVPLDRKMSDYIAPWREREIWLDISAEGTQITLTEAGADFEPLFRVTHDGIIHQDKPLHCHYSISVQDDSAVFSLWRTEADLEDLLLEAESLGIRNVIGLYQEWQGSGVPTSR